MLLLPRRLFWATLSHAIFSQYGEIMAACLNLMNVPIKDFFRESLRQNYGIENEERFLLPCITALLATIHLIVTVFLPQSPKYLFIHKNDEENARRALEFYYGEEGPKEIDGAIREMIHENKQAAKKNYGNQRIDQNPVIKPFSRFSLFLVFICSLVPVFSGLNIKSQYLVQLLISYGLSQSQSTIAIMVISAISLPISFIAPLIIEKYGRRPIFVLLTWLCAFEWLGLAIPEMANNFGFEFEVSWIFACLAAVLGQAAVNLGMLVMAPIMISELCPLNIRAKVSQATQVPPIAIAVLEVFMFPSLRAHFGFSMFLFLATCCAALATILHTQMLETAGLAVDEIVARLSGEPTLTRSNTSRQYTKSKEFVISQKMGQTASKTQQPTVSSVQTVPMVTPGFGRAQTMLDVAQYQSVTSETGSGGLQRSSSDTALNTSTSTAAQTACQKSYQQSLEWGRNEQFLKLAHTFHTNNY
ncbi:hypothetical protein B9Z55_021690 [Caenorhabditis nigoni]|uniref:Major facilitator superfamily (MFS) profile domain-containing protein n=1 Tax=Caenorhabditis nigoni TaxID=1611254 RepID=A0A2G5TU03_9PELO|nr:hypothetical protein B9Z55_021690 [Caenorhabditis nigoni]